MRLLVSGATVTMRRLAQVPFARAHLGHLHTPAVGNRIETYHETDLPWAADNSCFKKLDWPRYKAMIDRLKSEPVLWICVPDYVASGTATLAMFDGYYSILEDGDGMTPWALVAQDGMEDLDWDWFMDMASCMFIGGSTRWKLSHAAADLAREAKRRGLDVHMGRVNSRRRLLYCYDLGCVDTIDGTSCSMYPDIYIGHFLRWMREIEGLPDWLPFKEEDHMATKKKAAASAADFLAAVSGIENTAVTTDPAELKKLRSLLAGGVAWLHNKAQPRDGLIKPQGLESDDVFFQQPGDDFHRAVRVNLLVGRTDHDERGGLDLGRDYHSTFCFSRLAEEHVSSGFERCNSFGDGEQEMLLDLCRGLRGVEVVDSWCAGGRIAFSIAFKTKVHPNVKRLIVTYRYGCETCGGTPLQLHNGCPGVLRPTVPWMVCKCGGFQERLKKVNAPEGWHVA